eukprot:m.801212 g.801212  ORF g.801212 m.801212 type:complete len:484 (-) comp23357_c1_seq7:720-2171(-)
MISVITAVSDASSTTASAVSLVNRLGIVHVAAWFWYALVALGIAICGSWVQRKRHRLRKRIRTGSGRSKHRRGGHGRNGSGSWTSNFFLGRGAVGGRKGWGLTSTVQRRSGATKEGWWRRLTPGRRANRKIMAEVTADRVYCVSDVHTDITKNMAWLEELRDVGAASTANGSTTTDVDPSSSGDTSTSPPMRATHDNDFIIVAGDISDKIEVLRATLTCLRDIFGAGVAFVPGNHDLWCEKNGTETSLEKYSEVMRVCTDLGVHTRPVHLTGLHSPQQSMLIVPLLSWYHTSWDTEPDIPDLSLPPVSLAAMDFRRCRWPSWLNPATESVARHFDSLNKSINMDKLPDSTQVITFSHFLPFQQLLPEKRNLYYPHLPKIVGSDFLRERIRKMKPSYHIFGHTHFAWDSKIEGIRCIQAPVAYPHERRMAGGSAWTPFLLYDSTTAGFVTYPQPCRWSDYYRSQPRDPTNFELAPWVKEKLGLS